MQSNWAGSHVYRAQRLLEPRSLAELQTIVAGQRNVRALGSRHSFSDIADSDGALVSLLALPDELVIDEGRRSVTVSGGAVYGPVAQALQAAGWALSNMASLPHISVAGAVATGTHGSGDGNRCLSAAVASMEVVGADGEVRTVSRGGPDFDGSVVALGALGIVCRLTLDIEPTFDVRQDVYAGLSWPMLQANFEEVAASAYSVSVFTRWVGDSGDQVWLKSRGTEPPSTLFGSRPAAVSLGLPPNASTENLNVQGGVPGPWLDRLPHYRMAFTPSRGAELQSEYLLPRASAVTAFRELRRLGPRLAPVLHSSEIRTVAADDLWLSGAFGGPAVAVHLTWLPRPAAVRAVLPLVERALLPLGARPHWGKVFMAGPTDLAAAYPRLEDFSRLRRRMDPEDKFGNRFLDRVLGARPDRPMRPLAPS